MASRVGTGAFPRTTRGTTGASSATGNVPPASTSVRRNLFQSQLTRRTTPAAAGVSAASAASNNDGLRGGGLDRGDGTVPAMADADVCGNGDIIVRDRNGEMELVDPPSPAPGEMGEMALDAQQESERERQRLADTIKYHQQRTSIPGQPEDLLEALRASLRAKVSALAEDNWMYEPEPTPRVD